MKKILLIYYSQTGQTKDILDSLIKPFQKDNSYEFSFFEIEPVIPYKYPWSSDDFFDTFPESVLGIPCALQPFSISDYTIFDLIIIGYQPWYLSPSIPIQSFFQTKEAQKLLNGKPIITICGCRNMWMKSFEKIKHYIHNSGGNLIGNIVLNDRHNNLISVLTIIRWLLYGDKPGKNKLLPPAGISINDINYCSTYGAMILNALENNTANTLQEKIEKAGGVNFKPSIAFLELNASRIFKIWANFIIKKGSKGYTGRIKWIRLFKYYLLFAIYCISPIVTVLFFLFYPLFSKKMKKIISKYISIN